MSASEIALFNVLHNQDVVTQGPAPAPGSGSQGPMPAPVQGRAQEQGLNFEDAMRSARRAPPPPRPTYTEAPPRGPRVPLVEVPTPRSNASSPGSVHRAPPSRASSSSSAPSPVAPRAAPQPYSPPSPASSLTGQGVPVDIQSEKHNALLEIERLRQVGAVATRQWSMEHELEDMHLEARRLQANLDETQMVAMMREFLQLGFNGIEWASSFAPMVHLDGWAAAMSSDMSRYDPALCKLYRRYWRRATSSPEAELVMTVAMSMVSHHFKAKFQQARQQRPKPAAPTRVVIESDSDDEEMPPPPQT